MLELSPPVATLLAALFGGLLLSYVHRLNAKRAAAAKYRGAILGELGAIYPLPADWPTDIDSFLRRAFPRLQAAINEFRPFVSRRRRKAYDDAWGIYRNAYGRNTDIQVYHHYIAFTGQPDPKAAFYKNVTALLSFGQQT